MDTSKLFQSTKKKLHRKMRRSSHNLESSDLSEEKSDKEAQSYSEEKSSRRKSREERRRKRNVYNNVTSTSSDHDTTVIQIEPNSDNRYLDHSTETSRQAQTNRRRSNLRKIQNVRSVNIETGESDNDDFNRKSLDIVVDVHRENEITKSVSEDNPTKEFRTAKETNAGKSQNTNEKLPKTFKEEVKRNDLVKVASQESLDLIEELKDSPVHSYEDSNAENMNKNSMMHPGRQRKNEEGWFQEAEFHQVSSETSGKRRRWEKLDAANLVDDLKKIRRKQWTNDSEQVQISKEKVDDFQEKTHDSSSKSSSNGQLESKPVPAHRKNISITDKKHPRMNTYEFDNTAFVPDDEEEEVLRIETDYYQQNTEIKMSLRTNNVSEDQCIVTEEIYYKNAEDVSDDLTNSDTREELEFRRNERPKSRCSRRQNDDKIVTTGNSWHEDTRIRLKKTTSRKSKSVSNSRTEKEKENLQKYSSQDTTISSSGAYSDTENYLCLEKSRLKQKENERRGKGTRRKMVKNMERKESSRRSRTSSSTRGEELTNDEKTRNKEFKRKKKRKKNKKETIKFISIIVHRSDILDVDYITKHPMVKVHIVKAATGNYLENNDKVESESSYLQPIITGKYDFKKHKSMTPFWEEELIFEHNFDDLLQIEKEQILIFFEIVDLLTFSEASSNYDQYDESEYYNKDYNHKNCLPGSESCWYKVAWAFLRPVGINGVLHIDKKIRLQLYRPRKNIKKFVKHKCEAYEWWTSNIRERYPSSLYVTVSSVEQPKLEPVFYDQLTFNELSDFRSDSQQQFNKTSESESVPKWTRLADQSCKIPNDIFFETEISENGCFFVTFSHNGKYLACVISEEYDYPILVYKINEKKLNVRFMGHKNFVYLLNWSHDDRFLLSVSSDQTAQIWNVREKLIQYVQVLPHPSYVYCGKFSPVTSSIIATGCYDNVVRIWEKNKRTKSYELVQELEIHVGFINSLCFLKDNSLITADSAGIIILWTIKKNRKNYLKKEWHISRKIKIKEVKNITINTIVPHPQDKKLLIHSRNSSLLMLDLTSGEIIQRYEGLKNERIQIVTCISPCGSLILCGGEDSTLNIWSLESGKHLVKYVIDSNRSKAITCVDYHPYEHMLAFSVFGNPFPVKILTFDKTATGDKIGLTVLIEEDETRISTNFTENSSRTVNEKWSSDSRRKLDLHHSTEFSEASNYLGSTMNLLENYDSRKGLIMKLQRFIETVPVSRAASSSRMSSIIEKIDRILSNASSSRSPDDLESIRIPESSMNIDIKSTSDLVSDFSCETVRMKDLGNEKKIKKNRKHISKSARNNYSFPNTEKVKKASSDGAVNRKENVEILLDDEDCNLESNTLDNVESMATTSFNVESGFSSFSHEKVKELELESMESSVISNCNEQEMPKESDNNVDSDGTYVVEKGDVEKNHDFGSTGNSGSASSAKSNVTFIIENEIPIPKPRKKFL